MKENLVRGPKI